MAEIDLQALRQNAALVASRVAPAGLMAVVKADAYGHGAVACARALASQVWGFAVSLVEEGVELRRSGIEKPIVVLGGFYGRSHADVVAYSLTPVVFNVEDLERFGRAADELAAGRIDVHLKVDTGMARLGVRPERLGRLLEVAARVPGVSVAGLASHLADADGEDPAYTREQLAVFARARAEVLAAGFRPDCLHLANSAGAIRFPDARMSLVRPGLTLFGHSPPNVDLPGLRPVLRVLSRIVALRDVPAGASVGYGRSFVAARPSRIATIPLGYADGYPRRLSGRAEALVAGRRCPVAGAVSMDMTTIDVTEVPAGLGDEVVLVGSQAEGHITAEEFAGWAGTIVYEVCCGISKRVPRVYRGG